jgi:ribonucleoside-diphosphate reductase alpha chain
MGATAAEKSTGRGGELNAVSSGGNGGGGMGGGMSASGLGAGGGVASGGYMASPNLPEPEIVGNACTLRPGDPGFEECEACQ